MQIQTSIYQLQNIADGFILSSRSTEGQYPVGQCGTELQIYVIALFALRFNCDQAADHHGNGCRLLTGVALKAVLARAVEQVIRFVDQIRLTDAPIEAGRTQAANQGYRTILAAIHGVAVAFVVIRLVDACAMIPAWVVTLALVDIDLTVGAFKARIAFTGVGANLENNRKETLGFLCRL